MKNTIMLKKNYEFKRVLVKGKYFSGKYIEMYIRRNNLEINRIGIAISKKITNAVNRNCIKRLIRENYRLLENNIKKGYDIVFLWKKKIDIKEAKFYNIQSDFFKIFIEKEF